MWKGWRLKEVYVSKFAITTVRRKGANRERMKWRLEEWKGWRTEEIKGWNEGLKGWDEDIKDYDERMQGWRDEGMMGQRDEGMLGWKDEKMKGCWDERMKRWKDEICPKKIFWSKLTYFNSLSFSHHCLNAKFSFQETKISKYAFIFTMCICTYKWKQ